MEKSLPKVPGKGANVSALSFNGGQAVIVQDDKAFHDIEKDDCLTIEAWIRIRDFQRGFFPIMDKSNKTNGYGWYFEVSGRGKKLEFIGGVGAGASVSWDPPFYEWTHVAMSYQRSEGKVRFYSNGKLQGEVPYSSDVQPTSDAPLYIGQGPSGYNEYATGDIDEVRLWSRALATEEIQRNYLRKLTGSEQGLVGYWPFDEETGPNTKDLTGKLSTVLSPSNAPPTWELSVPALQPATKSLTAAN
jgi:hypothetical protein